MHYLPLLHKNLEYKECYQQYRVFENFRKIVNDENGNKHTW